MIVKGQSEDNTSSQGTVGYFLRGYEPPVYDEVYIRAEQNSSNHEVLGQSGSLKC